MTAPLQLTKLIHGSERRRFKDLIKSLALILDMATGQAEHTIRVALHAVQFGAACQLPAEQLRDLFYAGLLHEIGQVAADDGHERGAAIVAAIPTLERAALLVADHHRAEPHSVPGRILRLACLEDLAGAPGALPSRDPLAPYAQELARQGWWSPETLDAAQWDALQIDTIDLARLIDLEIDYVNVTLELIAQVIDIKHTYTQGHSRRVAFLAERLAREAGLNGHDCLAIRQAGFLHDAGKVGVPIAILDKPGKLNDREFAVMAHHPVLSCEIVRHVEGMEHLLPLIRGHHERWDGQGYPDRLAGEAIPLGARILTVADAYDAMTSTRAYRNGLPHETARAEVQKCSGQHFDPDLAALFLALPPDEVLAVLAK